MKEKNCSGDLRLVQIGWLLLLGVTLVFVLLYFKSSLFPGAIDPSVSEYFPQGLAEKARTYSFPLRIADIGHFCLQAALLLWLLFSLRGRILLKRIGSAGRGFWAVSLLTVVAVWLLGQFLSLPFSCFTYYWQKLWGFSTQTPIAWWIDYLKSAGISLGIIILGGVAFIWLVNHLPRYWWLVGAAFFSVWLIIEYLLWPVLISPIFNHFQPLSDPGVAAMVNNLAQNAGLQIKGVLVMDASRQTTLANAYFTGLGATKRIVLYDTLLHNYSFPEVKAVIAHEMGHWRHNDVIQGLKLGVLASFLAGGLLTIFLKPWLDNRRRRPAELWVALQCVLLFLTFVISPLQNSISRTMELRADAYSLDLTGNLAAEVQLEKDLSSRSLSDLSPPGFIVWFSYDHPPAITRIHALEEHALKRN